MELLLKAERPGKDLDTVGTKVERLLVNYEMRQMGFPRAECLYTKLCCWSVREVCRWYFRFVLCVDSVHAVKTLKMFWPEGNRYNI